MNNNCFNSETASITQRHTVAASGVGAPPYLDSSRPDQTTQLPNQEAIRWKSPPRPCSGAPGKRGRRTAAAVAAAGLVVWSGNGDSRSGCVFPAAAAAFVADISRVAGSAGARVRKNWRRVVCPLAHYTDEGATRACSTISLAVTAAVAAEVAAAVHFSSVDACFLCFVYAWSG